MPDWMGFVIGMLALWAVIVFASWLTGGLTAPARSAPATPMPRLYRTPQDAARAARRAEARTELATNIFCGILIIIFSIISFALFIAMLKFIVFLVI